MQACRREPSTHPFSSDDPTAIWVRGLRKTYDGVEAVGGIDLCIAQGEIFALLGPNGAGKTTAVEILEGFRQRTEGEVSVLGSDPQHAPRAWRDRLGIVLQESAPDPGLTVKESLKLYAGYYANPMDPDAVLALTGLESHAAELATNLSGGERRRLDFGLALVGDPDLIFLDEPTTGFDPAARRKAWDVITSLRSLGKTILLTTHYMDEAETLADRIAVMARGRVIAEGRPGTFGGRDRAATKITFRIPAGARDLLAEVLQQRLEAESNGRVWLSTTEPLAELERLARVSRTTSIPITDLEVRRPTLEEIYLKLTHSDTAESTRP